MLLKALIYKSWIFYWLKTFINILHVFINIYKSSIFGNIIDSLSSKIIY